jgi:hypothetical protein
MKIKISDRMIKILIFITFTIVPLVIMLNMERFDYYSAFDELKNATGIPREHLEIMNYWRRGDDYIIKVRIYQSDLFKVRFVKYKDSYRAEYGMFYDEGWQPLKQFLKKNNLRPEKYETKYKISGG